MTGSEFVVQSPGDNSSLRLKLFVSLRRASQSPETTTIAASAITR
jgi:hypothetical protein